MGMANIETESYVVEMCSIEDFVEAVGFGDFVRDVLNQHRYCEWLGEHTQVFESRDGVFHLARLPLFFGDTKMLHQESKRSVFGKLDGSFRFVHRGDTLTLVVID